MGLRSHLTPLRNRNFRHFFLGEVVNNAGSSMAGIARSFAVLAISNSASALGLVAAAWTVPMVGFMLLGGTIADRLPRALVLRGCNLIQGLVTAVGAALILTHTAEIWELVILQFISGTVFAVSYPAFHGMVPILLPPEERKAAYLLVGQSQSALSIAGPVVSGILVATVGAGWCLAADAVTYAAAAGFLSLMRLPAGERPDRKPSVVGDFVAGWSFARSLGWVIPVASCSLVFNALVSGAVGVLGPVIAKGTIGSGGWGLARAGEALGIFVSALFAARLPMRRPLRACVLAFTLTGVPMLALGTFVNTATLGVAFFFSGIGLSIVGLAWNLTVQEKVREDMLSRVMAIDGFFSFVAMPIGQVLVGPLALAFGMRGVQLGSAALCLLVGIVGAAVPAIASLRLDATDAEPEPAPAT